MERIVSCEFNMDTGCVEAKYEDGSVIAINYTPWRIRLLTICISAPNWTGSSTTSLILM